MQSRIWFRFFDTAAPLADRFRTALTQQAELGNRWTEVMIGQDFSQTILNKKKKYPKTISQLYDAFVRE